MRIRMRRTSPKRLLLGLLATLVLLALGMAAGAAGASAAEPWWSIDVHNAPTELVPGGEVVISAVATNLGNATADGSTKTMKMTDTLPAGIHVKTAECKEDIGKETEKHKTVEVECKTSGHTISWEYSGTTIPWGLMEIKVKGTVASAAELEAENGGALPTSLPNEASIEGGGAPRAATFSTPFSVARETGPGAFEPTRFGSNTTS